MLGLGALDFQFARPSTARVVRFKANAAPTPRNRRLIKANSFLAIPSEMAGRGIGWAFKLCQEIGLGLRDSDFGIISF